MFAIILIIIFCKKITLVFVKREFENIYIENALLKKGGEAIDKEFFKFGSVKGEKSREKEGEYVSLELPQSLFMNDELKEEAALALTKCVKDFLKKYRIKKSDSVLAVGVGNEGMTADSLGAKTLRYLEITEHFYREGIMARDKGRLSAVAGSVSGVTGLPSYEIIKGVTDRIKPSLIIAVDTLASRKTSRLQRVIQLSDKGITPGSGVNNAKTALSMDSLGVPVIAIGVPLVIYARNIIADYLEDIKMTANFKRASEELEQLVVTVKEIDVTVDDFARIIARSINNAVHG